MVSRAIRPVPVWRSLSASTGVAEPPEIAESDIVETIDTEILVCGGGTSGLFTVCAAAEEGAKVLCIEKSVKGGGVRDNLGSINSRLQREAGCVIDENEICNDLTRYATGYVNPRLYHVWAQNSGEAVDWYQDRLEEAGFQLFFESAPYDYVLNAVLTQPNDTVVNIWDSDYVDYIKQFDVHGCARVAPFDNGAPTNIDLDTLLAMNQGLVESGFVVQADTIEELAEGLGIPAENLVATVNRQNENYDKQVDPDFGKEPFRLSPIRKAPFFGVRSSGYMLCTLDGITINEQFQAMKADGTPVEGLYMAGVDSGSYCAGTYPNLSTGNCCGRSITFGRMLGKALAAK